MKTLVLATLLTAIALPALAASAPATGTFVEVIPATAAQTLNGTVSCTIDSTNTIVTCTFSQPLALNSTITISVPSGL